MFAPLNEEEVRVSQYNKMGLDGLFLSLSETDENGVLKYQHMTHEQRYAFFRSLTSLFELKN